MASFGPIFAAEIRTRRILLENYFLTGDLEAQIEAFVEHYNHRRYEESLDNVTPADRLEAQETLQAAAGIQEAIITMSDHTSVNADPDYSCAYKAVAVGKWPRPFDYDAFISYRRADGFVLARWLRRKLQTYRLPERVIEQLSTEKRALAKSSAPGFSETSQTA